MNREITCVSSLGDKINFSNSFPFVLEEITGIHEKVGSVATVKSAFGIGSRYIDTSINDREIVITGTCKNKISYRDTLYKTFPFKEPGTLFYYEDDIARKIDYQVESVKISQQYTHNVFEISLLCPSPYFTDINESVVKISNWKKLLKFPLKINVGTKIKFGSKETSLLANINNLSNIEIGMRIIFEATANVENPSITNLITGETIKINEILNVGDSIEITTYPNQKNIYVEKEGEKIRKNNALVFGSKFLQIHSGTNIFKSDAERGFNNLIVSIYYYNSYEAI